MQMAAHSSSFGSSFGSGGRGGKGGFGRGMGGGGFGRSRDVPTDPHAFYMEAQHNPELMHGHHGFMRQNSLLSEMTQSKSERDKKPWGVAGFGYMNQEGGMMPYNIYDKPLEKTEKPKLQRQNTCPITGLDNPQPKRAPSFRSDPEKMRGKTISSSSLPTSRPPMRKLSRSISINEDLTVPANMDIAMPILRRQQSLDAEKAAKRRNSTSSSKIKFPFAFGRRRKSVKSTSDTDSIQDTTSLSIPGTPRSRSYTNDSRDSAGTTESAISRRESADKNQEKLILSLMNPEVSDNHESGYEDQTTLSQDESKDHVDSPLESPTVVSKRVQQNLHLEEDHSVPEPFDIIPQGTPTKGSPRLTATMMMMGQRTQLSKCSEATDSDASDAFYDCSQNSPANNSQRKKRSLRKKRSGNSTSTCTDGEDTTSSTCDTPPRKAPDTNTPRLYPDTRSLISYEESHKPRPSYENADTLKLRDQGYQKEMVERKKRALAAMSMKFSQTIHDNEVHEAFVEPALVNGVTNERDQKDNLPDPCTADSSESGYGTSHRQTTPRDYHQKVSEFVNSLPSKPMMVERNPRKHATGLNGSISDIDIEDDHKSAAKYPKHKLDFNDEVSCVSGSDTDNESDGDVSVSKLEVMKLLESPTDVRARVNDVMSKKVDNSSFADKLPSPTYLYKKELEPVQNEPVIATKSETADKSEQTEKPHKLATKHVEVNCVVENKEDSDKEDKVEFKRQKSSMKSQSSNGGNRSEKFSFSRQFSTIYQSNSTSCVDLVLHFFNFLLFVTSAGIIGLSIWLLLKDFNVNDVTIILGNDLLKIIIYVAISGSAVAMLAAFCLCCGMRQDKVGLGFYAIILVVVICAFATSAILATIFSDKLRGIEFKFHFKDRLETMYGTECNQDCEELTKAWDLMQTQFKCCGGEGNENGSDSWALYQKTQWFKNLPEKGLIFVPESCCRRDSNTEACQGGDHKLYGPPRFGPIFNSFFMKNVHLNTDGCYQYFASYLKTLCLYIAITVGSLAGLYALIVILTWIFCFKKQKDYKYYNDDSYTDYDDTDEVFEESVHRSRPLIDNIEETSFSSSQRNSWSHGRENPRESEHMHSKRDYTNQQSRYDSTRHREDSRQPRYDLGRHGHYEEDNPQSRYDPDRYEHGHEYYSEGTNNHRPRYDSGRHGQYREDNHPSRYDSGRNLQHYSEDEEDSESENGDTVSRASVKSQEEVIARRNMWLSSGNTAGHLLSVAIEEEEDSYPDENDIGSNRYRRYP